MNPTKTDINVRPPSRRWRQLARPLACGSLLMAALTAQADYLWLQPGGAPGQLRVQAGELHKPLAKLPALQDAKAPLSEGKAASFEQAADHYSLGATGGDASFAATRVADGVVTYYQARFGRNETKPVNDLELVPTEPGGNTFRLMFKGRPVAASQVNVETSEGWRRTLRPAQDGTVSVVPSFPGLYVLEVSARVNNASVTVEGKKYDDVRHTATLSFDVLR